MDIYPRGGSQFVDVYQDFHQHWSDVPFIIGEIGSKNGGSTSDKNAWLKQLTDQSALQAWPNYLGFLKGVDFRVATGGTTAAQGIID